METRVCRETSVFLLWHIKIMLRSTSCYTHYSCVTRGAQIISFCHKSCDFVYISKKQMPKSETSALQGHFHMSASHSKQHPVLYVLLQLRALREGYGGLGVLWTPEDDVSFDSHPAHIFLFHQVRLWRWKIGNKTKPLSTSQCIHLGLHKTPPHSSVAFFVWKQANNSHQAVMYYVFTDTFAYLIGAISQLRFRQLRKCPQGPCTAS